MQSWCVIPLSLRRTDDITRRGKYSMASVNHRHQLFQPAGPEQTSNSNISVNNTACIITEKEG